MLYVISGAHHVYRLGFYQILGQAPKYLRPNDKMSRTDLQVHIYLIPDATVLLQETHYTKSVEKT